VPSPGGHLTRRVPTRRRRPREQAGRTRLPTDGWAPTRRGRWG
jgi:hypothetical protein